MFNQQDIQVQQDTLAEWLGVGLLSRWGLPAWARIPQVSIFSLRKGGQQSIASDKKFFMAVEEGKQP